MSVRLRHSAALAGMLLVFFRRRVLRAGVLRSAPVRVLVVAAAALLLGTMCAAAYLFLRPLADDTAVWRLLFDASTISLVLWVQIAFLMVKVLFVNAEGLLQLTTQLPVTNRERAVAFLLYEAAMTGVVAAAGLVSLMVSALLLLGPSALPLILACVVLPAALTYLGLSVLHQALTRLWALVGLRRIAHVLSVLALFALLAVYSAHMRSMIPALSRAYLDKEPRHLWVTTVSWAWERWGAVWTLPAALLAAAALVALALVLTPSQYVRQSRYVNIRAGRLGRLLGPYDWCLLRSSQTVAGAAMAVALFVFLLLRPGSANPLWGLAVLSLGGLYQFTATQPLRAFPGAHAESAWRVYGRLLKAQLVLLGVFAVPATALVAAAAPGRLDGTLPALAGCAGGAVVTTCVSVVFPAEKDNPFSVFLGLSVVGIVLALTAIGLGMLSLPPWALGVCLAAATVVFVLYTVQGIATHESRRRNETGHVGHEVRRRGRPADAGDRGGDPADPHVLHGR